ncbi:hypothetical protein L596_025488 [Steinernema carpocapsae]|uniref:Uncharacterized protein n=1 Tax=Steinernema carpocapsae TaxID=34508 RepID=A0A4U5M7Z4_STECR|nr:hypothetical protein L596_025488 [Steinernema carpocapsae]
MPPWQHHEGVSDDSAEGDRESIDSDRPLPPLFAFLLTVFVLRDLNSRLKGVCRRHCVLMGTAPRYRRFRSPRSVLVITTLIWARSRQPLPLPKWPISRSGRVFVSRLEHLGLQNLMKFG